MARIAGEKLGAAAAFRRMSVRVRRGPALLFGEDELTRFLQIMLRTFDELKLSAGAALPPGAGAAEAGTPAAAASCRGASIATGAAHRQMHAAAQGPFAAGRQRWNRCAASLCCGATRDGSTRGQRAATERANAAEPSADLSRSIGSVVFLRLSATRNARAAATVRRRPLLRRPHQSAKRSLRWMTRHLRYELRLRR